MSEIPGQPTIITDLRGLIDDLQGSTTRRDWGRRAAALTAYLLIVDGRWRTMMVSHNLGKRRYEFLVDFANEPMRQ